MKRLEVSGAVRPLKWCLGVKRLTHSLNLSKHFGHPMYKLFIIKSHAASEVG